jgi:hypothetical protein
MKRLALALLLAGLCAAAPARTLSRDVARTVEQVLARGDNAGAPFVVIDKRGARLWLFLGDGLPLGSTPVLLGLARGDHTVPGIGERPMAQIAPHERTTPAGRFVAEHGRNHTGEDILWVDYDAAVSMHRVRPTNPRERRLQRLASPTAGDNRISYGCINVPKAFYEDRLLPAIGRARPVVYVLPETQPAATLFTPPPVTGPSAARN